MKKLLAVMSVILGCCAISHAQSDKTNCNQLNQTYGPFPYGPVGNAIEHGAGGGHGWSQKMTATCTYTGVAVVGSQTACHPHSTVTSVAYPYENGITVPDHHYAVGNTAQGLADCPNGEHCKSDGEGASMTTSCQSSGCGAGVIGITGGGAGGSFGVNFQAANGSHIVFSDKRYYPNDCTGYTLKALPSSGGGGASSCPFPPANYPPPYTMQGFIAVWNTATCSWNIIPSSISPVAIDTKGDQWNKEQFTDPAKECVRFDMKGDGVVHCYSFPKPGSGVGWLVYDLDGDKRVKNGKWLYGEFSPHADNDDPNYPTPNGFNALNRLDRPEQGGNGDLIISSKDSEWAKLYIWIPGKHCYKDSAPCQGTPDELHRPEDLGVTSISAEYGGSVWKDSAGNEYRFQTVLNPLAETVPGHGENHKTSKDARVKMAYDVWITFNDELK
jgi:hypothetical protein